MQHMRPGEKLAFLGSKSFSATFYSQGRAEEITMENLILRLGHDKTLYLAVPKSNFETVSKSLGTQLPKVFESREYVFTFVSRNQPRS